MSTFNVIYKVVLVTLIVLVYLAFHTAVDVFAQGNDLRANACRTFHVFAHEAEQTGETDGFYCGTVESVKEDKPADVPPMTTIVIVPDEPETPIIIEIPIIEDDDTPPNDEIIPDEPIEDDTPPADEGKQKCNKGEGNGSEGCDPGNHPELGNNDEDNGNHGPDNGGNPHN